MPVDVATNNIAPVDSLYPEGWGKDHSGSVIRFGETSDAMWGIELRFSLDEEIRKHLKFFLGLDIQKNIKGIRYLDLTPQESLPPKLRTTNSTRRRATYLQLLADVGDIKGRPDFYSLPFLSGGMGPKKYLESVFLRAFGLNRKVTGEFSRDLAAAKGGELVIVYGHGGPGDTRLGEQGDTMIDKDGQKVPRVGYEAEIEEILEKYDHPDKYAAIILISCFTGSHGDKVRAKRIPVAVVDGPASIFLPWAKPNILRPKE